MKWRRVKKLLQKKPYLIDPYRRRSVADAKKMLTHSPTVSSEDMLNAARTRAGMTPAQWREYTGVSEQTMRRICKRTEPVRLARIFTVTRRAAIVWTIILLIASYTILTPTGRAWAVSAYYAVVEIVGGILHVRTGEKDDGLHPVARASSALEKTIYFDSIEGAIEFLEETVYYFSTGNKKMVYMKLVTDPLEGKYLETGYNVEYDVGIVLIQKLNASETNIILDSSKEYIRYVLKDGLEVHGAYSEDDKAFVGIVMSEDAQIEIFIKNVLDGVDTR